jgi:hypothetical protein
MKLWIATDDLSNEPMVYTRQPEKLIRDGFVVWSPTKGDVMSTVACDFPLPPPGDCWEFDVEFRRVK